MKPIGQRLKALLNPTSNQKAIAEKAAWDFIKVEGGSLELTTLCPTGIFGPALGRDLSASFAIIQGLMTGAFPFSPKIYFGIVDVRDVAELHLTAMTSPKAAGERFLVTSGRAYSMHEVANMLKKRMSSYSSKVPSFEIPSFALRLLAVFNPKLKGLLPNLGIVRRVSNEKTKTLLNWMPRPAEEAVVTSAQSLLRFGVVDVA